MRGYYKMVGNNRIVAIISTYYGFHTVSTANHEKQESCGVPDQTEEFRVARPVLGKLKLCHVHAWARS